MKKIMEQTKEKVVYPHLTEKQNNFLIEQLFCLPQWFLTSGKFSSAKDHCDRQRKYSFKNFPEMENFNDVEENFFFSPVQ